MLRLKQKKLVITVAAALFLVIVTVAAWPSQIHVYKLKKSDPNVKTITSNQPKKPVISFNKQKYPTNEASSLWVVVNKGRVLPSTYIPQNLTTPSVPLRRISTSSEMKLRSDAAKALEDMFTSAKKDNISLKLASGYRSYALQQQVYVGYVKNSGIAKADTFSARQGHSEHQTGLAADVEPDSQVCELDVCFKNTPEGQWLAVNCFKYGFIIRYQENKQTVTGYQFEPWHIRYVGVDLAIQIKTTNQTLEQFFGLPVYETYPSQQYEIKNV
jgi:D-alanyl-D-alanine carboxypeptidase